MATRSVIEIDVQDESFKRFQTLFEKFQHQVDSVPGAWANVDKSIKNSKSSTAQLVAAFSAAGEAIKKAETTQQKFKAAAQGSGKVFGVMAVSTSKIAKNIKAATSSLLRWASLTSVFSGLLGVGGLFGIDRLGRAASEDRRQAQGLGITPGEHSAAKINLQRYVDVDSMLQKIQDARTDVTKRWAFSAAGVSQSDVDSKSNAALLAQLLPVLKRQAEANPTQQGAQAHGLLEFADMETLTRLKAVQQQEIASAVSAYEKDKQLLSMTDKTLASWQLFDAQLQRSSQQIKNTFIEALAGLTGPMSRLSAAVSNAVKILMSSASMSKWIDALGAGIERFAKYLASDEFKKDVDSTMNALDVFAGALYSAGKTLGKIFGAGSEKTLRASEYRKLDELRAISPKLADRVQKKMESPQAEKEFSWWSLTSASGRASDDKKMLDEAMRGSNGAQVEAIMSALGQPTGKQSAFGKIKPLATPAGAPGAGGFGALESKYGLPSGLLASVEKQESGGKDIPGPVTKTGERAQGPFQFMKQTAIDYGVANVHDEGQAAQGAAKLYAHLIKKYDGDIRKALAAYNWGEGNVDKNGMDKIPDETREYIRKIMGDMQSKNRATGDDKAAPAQAAAPKVRQAPAPIQPVSVAIYNNTGGNVYSTVNGLT